MCVYITLVDNVQAASGEVFAGCAAGLDAAENSGFYVYAKSTGDGDMLLRYVGASKAP
ncbi:MAG: hypothetical protein JWN68_2814 [Nocardioides sp.]|jgi:hypothetical protein|uniref:hypothetical protein n=1 Tax=Nocardioides sp. TaxID=35761 RepID=UPI00261078F4|nr:hypothetical protein [Nocardioides sp.]MCW2834861.1 hypothetical protein [Nocardioides sp.]